MGMARAWLPSRRSTLHQMGARVRTRLGHCRSGNRTGGNGRYFSDGDLSMAVLVLLIVIFLLILISILILPLAAGEASKIKTKIRIKIQKTKTPTTVRQWGS